MASSSLLRLCLFSLIQTTSGLQPADHLVMFASAGDSISLSCGIPSLKSCSSVNWNRSEDFEPDIQLVQAGVVLVTAPKHHRLKVAKDCSLQINPLEVEDAQRYTCGNGAFNSSVSFEILTITQKETGEEIIELHCSLNTYKGLISPCNSGIHFEWLTEANTQIKGNRFKVERQSGCLSKLFITRKPTDHHRKWRCRLTQNDTVKTTATYTTTVADGVEEVFAVVGESVSFSCENTSSLGVGGRLRWERDTGSLTDVTSEKGHLEGFQQTSKSSLLISKVSALHSGNYTCSLPGKQEVLNRFRLHTLEITPEYGSGGDNLTLTCLLTCALTKCDEDFNLTWTGSIQHGSQNSSIINNTLILKLFLPDLQSRRGTITCSVSREGVVMASVMWSPIKSLQAVAWLALPLGLLVCAIAGGIYVYLKRKHNTDAGNDLPNIGMTPVYEDIGDVNHEEVLQQHQPQRGVTTTDSFYDLLQAVN